MWLTLYTVTSRLGKRQFRHLQTIAGEGPIMDLRGLSPAKRDVELAWSRLMNTPPNTAPAIQNTPQEKHKH